MVNEPGPTGSSDGFLPRLSPPPRRVPFSLRARLLFGGLGTFAWLSLAFGGGMSAVFLGQADLTSWLYFRGEVTSAPGTALGCEGTGASEGGSKHRRGTPIFANRYRFEAGGVEAGSGGVAHEGVSYAPGRCLEAGTAVRVEHVPGHPERSRIAGMRRATFGPSVALVAVFPAVGLGLVIGSLWAGRRRVRLLEHGRLALGTLVGKEATNVRVNRRTVMKLRFALVTEAGTRHEVVIKTHAPEALEDEPRERLFYDPERPDRAMAWDALPARPKLDGTGNLEPAGFGGTVLALLPPLVTLLVLAFVLAR